MSGTVTVFVPRETAAISLGADEVAAGIVATGGARQLEIDLKRNGSWGMSWLEPLVEVVVGGERLAYGPVSADDVASLFEAGFLSGGEHPLKLGPTSDIPYLRTQDSKASKKHCSWAPPASLRK
jgi:formate dehydrogenase iron-sulfur subunit